jgi:long-chain acyl-CoA synthetase
MKTIRNLVDSFSSVLKRPAIIYNGVTLNYDRFYHDICSISNSILSYNVKEKPIMVVSNSKYEFIVGIYAIMYSGNIAVPLANSTTPDELRDISNKIDSNLIICNDELILKGIQANYNNIIKSSSNSTTKIKPKVSANTPCLILFTSGTSGEKKGTLLSHSNLIQTTNYINIFMEVRDEIQEYIMIPLFHSFGFARTRCVFIKHGTIVIDDGLFNPLLALKRMKRFKCNAFSGVPAVMAMLIEYTGNKLKNIGGKIKYVEIGSAPMLLKNKQFLIEHLPNARICMHYGLTEASRNCFIEFRSEQKFLNSVGKNSPGVFVKIMDGNRELPAYKLGEIVVSGPNVAMGYYNDPKRTKEKFIANWFYTGDLGYKDDDAYVYFHGRKDDIINVGGEKVAPTEIENLIIKQNVISMDFCIVGIEDEKGIYGSIPVLCVKDQWYSKEDFIKLQETLTLSKIDDFKIPKKYFIIDDIPKTHNGKIQRNLIVNKISNNF